MALNELLLSRPNRCRLSTGWYGHADPFGALERRTGRFFDNFFRDFAIDPGMGLAELQAGFAPNVSVTETDSEIVVSAELPGVDENDVEITLEQGRLTIKGEKKHEEATEDKHCYRMERSYGSFQRAFELPCEVDEDKSEAEFKQGVLTVTLAKAADEKEQARKIQIKNS